MAIYGPDRAHPTRLCNGGGKGKGVLPACEGFVEVGACTRRPGRHPSRCVRELRGGVFGSGRVQGAAGEVRDARRFEPLFCER
jgi:hypothetical protein